VLNKNEHRRTNAVNCFESRHQISRGYGELYAEEHFLLENVIRTPMGIAAGYAQSFKIRLCACAPQLASVHWRTIKTKQDSFYFR